MKKWNRLTIAWGTIMLMIFSGLTYLSLLWKQLETNRKEFEVQLIEATKEYLKEQKVFPLGLETLRINIEDIISYGSLDTEKIKSQNCAGYIKVWEDDEDHYEPFLKCKLYERKGYSEE